MPKKASFFECLFRNRSKRWWVVSFGLAILTLAWMANLQTLNTCLQQTPSQHDMLDFQFSGLHSTTGGIMFDWDTQVLCHGVTRPAKEVAKIAIARDWGFILVYVVFAVTIIGAVGRSCSWPRRRRSILVAVIIIAGVADVIENILLLNFALNVAEVNLAMAEFASIAAVTKFSLLALAALLVAAPLLACMYRCRS